VSNRGYSHIWLPFRERDGSLTEITSVTIPYNCPQSLAGFEFAQLTAARSDAQHAPLCAARRGFPKESKNRGRMCAGKARQPPSDRGVVKAFMFELGQIASL
jgi:hypothetical protein